MVDGLLKHIYHSIASQYLPDCIARQMASFTTLKVTLSTLSALLWNNLCHIYGLKKCDAAPLVLVVGENVIIWHPK